MLDDPTEESGSIYMMGASATIEEEKPDPSSEIRPEDTEAEYYRV